MVIKGFYPGAFVTFKFSLRLVYGIFYEKFQEVLSDIRKRFQNVHPALYDCRYRKTSGRRRSMAPDYRLRSLCVEAGEKEALSTRQPPDGKQISISKEVSLRPSAYGYESTKS